MDAFCGSHQSLIPLLRRSPLSSHLWAVSPCAVQLGELVVYVFLAALAVLRFRAVRRARVDNSAVVTSEGTVFGRSIEFSVASGPGGAVSVKHAASWPYTSTVCVILTSALRLVLLLWVCWSGDSAGLSWAAMLEYCACLAALSILSLGLAEECAMASQVQGRQLMGRIETWCRPLAVVLVVCSAVTSVAVVSQPPVGQSAWLRIIWSSMSGTTILSCICALWHYSRLSCFARSSTRPASSRRRGAESREAEPLLQAAADATPNAAGTTSPAESVASVPSLAAFSWLNDLFELGVRRQLNMDDIEQLAPQDESSRWGAELATSLRQEAYFHMSRSKTPSLFRALWRVYGGSWFRMCVLNVASTAMSFAGPLMLHTLLQFSQADSSQGKVSTAVSLVVMMSLSACFSGLISTQYSFRIARLKMWVRAGLVSNVFDQMLSCSPQDAATFSQGTVTNLFSTDVQKILDAVSSTHQLVSLPLQVATTLYLMFRLVRWAFLAGLVVLAVFLPLNTVVAQRIGALTDDLMKHRDDRVSSTAEYLRSVRIVKSLAWETPLVERIRRARGMELRFLRQRKYLDAVCVYLWASTPVLVSVATFCSVAWLNPSSLTPARSTTSSTATMSASTVFTSLALLHTLIFPMNAFPWVVSGLLEARVSWRRLTRFLVHSSRRPAYVSLPGDGPVALAVVGSFRWPAQADGEAAAESKVASAGDDFTLGPLRVELAHAESLIVAGSVASGKSTLFAAILGDAIPSDLDSYVHVTDGAGSPFSYAPQSPWIFGATLQDNVTFGQPVDEARLRDILHAVCLDDDGIRPGDEIGQRGLNLSGGQRARVGLARALYANSTVVLADDPVSALDVSVGSTVWTRVFGHAGLLRREGRASIVVTHDTRFFDSVDRVLVLEQGTQVALGVSSTLSDDERDLIGMKAGETKHVEEGTDAAKARTGAPEADSDTSGGEENVALTREEIRRVGQVAPRILASYVGAVGKGLAFSVLFSLLFMQLSRNASDWWLGQWADAAQGSQGANLHFETLRQYMVGFVSIASINTVATVLRAFLFAEGGLRGARRIHDRLLHCVAFAPLKFHDSHPAGRLLNRFSTDTYSNDDSLPFIGNICLAQLFGLFGTMAVVAYATKGVILLAVPVMTVMYFGIQRKYRASSRELKRLDSVSRSPIYTHFDECAEGAHVIRAFALEQYALTRCMDNLVDNQRVVFTSNGASQWLAVRLQAMGVGVLTCVALMAVMPRLVSVESNNFFTSTTSGLAGLGLTYALPVVSMLQGLLGSFSETEKEIISVERALEYSNVPNEEEPDGVGPPRPGWPSTGSLSFERVQLKYDSADSLALNNVTLHVSSGKQLGIVGRTGSGKSSVLSALWRLYEIRSGIIAIDGVDISAVPMRLLRSKLAIVPQEPLLLSGTVRFNLDPSATRDDAELHDVLQKCHLVSHDASHENRWGVHLGLDTVVDNQGSNWSAGMRQLLCLARALLQEARVVALDEATASMNEETDELVRRTLSENLPGSTLIIVAHRLSSVLSCDEVIVMHQGCVMERGLPSDLLARRDSEFRRMYDQSVATT